MDLAQGEERNAEDEQEGQDINKGIDQQAAVIGFLARKFDAIRFEQRGQRGVIRHRDGIERFPTGGLTGDAIIGDLHRLDRPFGNLFLEVGIKQLGTRSGSATTVHGDDQQQAEENSAPYQQALDPRIGTIAFRFRVRIVVVVAHCRAILSYAEECRRTGLNGKFSALPICAYFRLR